MEEKRKLTSRRGLQIFAAVALLLILAGVAYFVIAQIRAYGRYSEMISAEYTAKGAIMSTTKFVKANKAWPTKYENIDGSEIFKRRVELRFDIKLTDASDHPDLVRQAIVPVGGRFRTNLEVISSQDELLEAMQEAAKALVTQPITCARRGREKFPVSESTSKYLRKLVASKPREVKGVSSGGPLPYGHFSIDGITYIFYGSEIYRRVGEDRAYAWKVAYMDEIHSTMTDGQSYRQSLDSMESAMKEMPYE
jgi:hypothetical protein